MYKQATNDYFLPSFLKSTPIKIFIVAFIYNALAFISYQITVTPDNIAPIYPAAGFALASVLIMGRKTLIGIWVGSIVANLFAFWDTCQMLKIALTNTIMTAVLVATGVTLGAALGAYCINILNKGEYPLKTGFSVILFLAVSVFYCAICSLLGVSAISLFGLSDSNQFIFNWTTWWQGDLIGTIILTPFLTSWLYRYHIKIIATSLFEAIALGLATILICVLVAFDHADDQYLLLIVLLWATFRFRIRGVSIIAALFALLSTLYGSLGYGTFAILTPEEALTYINSFFGLSTIIALIMAGFYSDYLHKKLDKAKA
ncbi:MASE1 domain-containing protein [Flavobacterium sp. RSSA_27]|uniref:MASE1 domain-containing protein n=1 Tax=Flavobacterium sp. RSSA_27 TaxID=3447667 RepID=UPI003F397754